MPKKGEKKLHPVNCDHWCITLGPDSEHFAKISRDEFNAICGSSSNLLFLTLSKCLRLLSYPDISIYMDLVNMVDLFSLRINCVFLKYYTDDN